MMASDFIVDVNEADFEYQVLEYSQETPVVVDFWAEWCAPCKVLGPMLERMAHEAQGAFRLAKVNVDQNPNLAQRYNIRSIPAVKAFKNGQQVAEFAGAIPEPRLQEFIKALVPGPYDLLLEKGLSLLNLEQPDAAEETFNQILEEEPDNPAAMLGLARSLLWQGRAIEALYILRDFPASKQYTDAQALLPLAQSLDRVLNSREFPDDPLEAAYENALRLAGRGNLEAAMDGLLDILRQNKRFRNDEARKVYLGLLSVLGEENPTTQQYRQELASVLF